MKPQNPLAIPRSTDVRLWDPFLTPDWRNERVLKLVDRVPTPARTTKRDDEYIKAFRSFLLRWRAWDEVKREELLYENPGLYYAYKIHERIESDPETAFMLQARLLANQDHEEIAEAVKTEPPTVEWYQALFFNVTPFLRNSDWIVKHVLLPAHDRLSDATNQEEGDNDDQPHVFVRRETPPIVLPHLDLTLKWFSYFGGPILCDFMINGFKKGVFVRNQDEIGEWLDEHWGHTIRKRSAQSAGVFQIDKWNVVEVFATHARIIELTKGMEGEERRTAFERHVHSMLTEIPWLVGSEAEEVYAGTQLGQYDEGSVELRDDELLFVSAGQEGPQGLEEIPPLLPNFNRIEKKDEDKEVRYAQRNSD